MSSVRILDVGDLFRFISTRRVKLLFLALAISRLVNEIRAADERFFFIEAPLKTQNGNQLTTGTLIEALRSDERTVDLRIYKKNGETGWTEQSVQQVSKAEFAKAPKRVAEQKLIKNSITIKRRNNNFYPLYFKSGETVCNADSVSGELETESHKIIQAASQPTAERTPIPPVRIPDRKIYIPIPAPASRAAASAETTIPEINAPESGDLTQKIKSIFKTKFHDLYGSAPFEYKRLRHRKPKVTEGPDLLQFLADTSANGLFRAKRLFLKTLQEQVENKKITGQEASDILVAITLFGEFRQGKTTRYAGKEIPEFFPRSPAHLFWTMKVLDERIQKPNKFSNIRVQINMPGKKFPDELTIDWLKRTPGAAALARSQFSSWNIVPENDNLAVMLNPGHEETGWGALNEITQFVRDYRAGRYEIVGKDPHIDHYDSPTCYYSVPSLSQMTTEERWLSLKNRVKFKMVDLPAIRDKKTGTLYHADTRCFIGGI